MMRRWQQQQQQQPPPQVARASARVAGPTPGQLLAAPAPAAEAGSDLKAAVSNTKLTSISFTASSSTSSSTGRLVSAASDGNLNKQEGLGGRMPSLTAGIGSLGFPLLAVGDAAAAAAADVQRALSPCQGASAPGPVAEAESSQDQAGMGEEMAVKLLAQLPEESVEEAVGPGGEAGHTCLITLITLPGVVFEVCGTPCRGD